MLRRTPLDTPARPADLGSRLVMIGAHIEEHAYFIGEVLDQDLESCFLVPDVEGGF